MSKVVMNSREMAKLTGKTHGNLMTTIRRYVSRGELDLEESSYVVGVHGNTKAPEFRMTKQQVIAVMDKLSSRDRKVLSKHLSIKAIPTAADKPAVVTTAPEVSVQQPLVSSEVSPVGDVVTMSSVEIAELTGKLHKNVMADVRKMLEALNNQPAEFSARYLDSKNESRECFNLPRDLTETLITGYNIPLRRAVVVRLRQLEEKVAKPQFVVPTTFLDALKLAGELEEKRLALTHQVEVQVKKITEDKPKVEFYEEFVDSKELQSVGEVAKILGTGPILLFRYLQKHKILIGGTGDNKNMPFQKYINSGRMDVKYNNHTVPDTGEVKIRPKPLFTRKGVDWIREFVKENGRVGL